MPEATDLARQTEIEARKDIGLMEVPHASNCGPVEKYQDYTGLPHGTAYCASACSFWVHNAAVALGATPKFVKSGSALHLWSNNPDLQVTELTADMLPCVGLNIDADKIHGHAFLIIGLADDGTLTTIDPNSDPGGSREGTGVYLLQKRSTKDSNRLGYLTIA